MNTSLFGVLAALVVATGLWWTGRRPRPLLKSTDTREVAALNRAQNSLVWEARHTPPTADPDGQAGSEEGAEGDAWSPRWPLASLAGARLSPGERQAWLRELRRHHQAGGDQRLAAMRRARAWGDRAVLPLLRLGLRDGDPRVMAEAALAMEAFRGRPRPAQATASPRNVARTR